MKGPETPETRIELARGVTIAPEVLRFSYSRSSGPGGQSVNKLNTRATLRVRLADIRGLDAAAGARLRRLAGRRLTQDDEIIFRSGARRSQWQNRQTCVERFKAMVAEAAVRPRTRRRTRPSRAQIERRLRSKREQSEKKRRRRSRGHDD